MANLPIRNLGVAGVVTDPNPYDLPPNAFSDCNNVIFDDGVVQRAPVFKRLFAAIKSALSFDGAATTYTASGNSYENAEGSNSNDSRFLGSYSDPIFGETVFVVDRTGVVRTYPQGNLSFATPLTGTVTNDNVWTHTQVAGLSILARKGMRPYVRNVKSDTEYSHMANDWGVNDHAAIVRSYLDYALMLNVSKAGVDYPTMVKWSNPIPYGAAANSLEWDASNTNFIAGENVLGDLKTEIRDGMTLGNAFIIYAQDQVWLMEYTGSAFVFNFRRLFADGGIINTNCAVEIDGRHFVFGEDDIYTHDGVSKQSVADSRVRRRIFNTLNRGNQKNSFVVHDSVSNLIFFCYNSNETGIGFPNTQFANRAAVYNYRNNTWSFMDLPNIVGGAEVNVLSIKPRLPVMLGVADNAVGLSESRIYAVDLPEGMLVDLPVEPETLKPCVMERIGLDLDDMAGLPLRAYKTVKGMVPQVSAEVPLEFSFGSSDIPGGQNSYFSTQMFYPTTMYKLDMRVSGRYLSYKITLDTTENFKVSGFDLDVISLSRR